MTNAVDCSSEVALGRSPAGSTPTLRTLRRTTPTNICRFPLGMFHTC